jgi:hypothetical protein
MISLKELIIYLAMFNFSFKISILSFSVRTKAYLQ